MTDAQINWLLAAAFVGVFALILWTFFDDGED